MPVANDTQNKNIEALFGAGAHIGYSKSRRHPKMLKFIFCTRNNVEIFNLQKTDDKIKEAEAFLCELGKNGKIVLWVGTKPSAKVHIKSVGERLNLPYVSGRWLGGTLTNFKVIESRLLYLEKLEKEVQSGELGKYVKKERTTKMAELERLNKMFEGLRILKSMPDAIVIVDSKEEIIALSEARKKNIEIVALLNNDCNPDNIRYPIPTNDSSSGVISLILNRLATAYGSGKKEQNHANI